MRQFATFPFTLKSSRIVRNGRNRPPTRKTVVYFSVSGVAESLPPDTAFNCKPMFLMLLVFPFKTSQTV